MVYYASFFLQLQRYLISAMDRYILFVPNHNVISTDQIYYGLVFVEFELYAIGINLSQLATARNPDRAQAFCVVSEDQGVKF